MSGKQLANDQQTITDLDNAVAEFKRTLGSDNGDDITKARSKCYEALMICTFRAAQVRGQRKRGEVARRDNTIYGV